MQIISDESFHLDKSVVALGMFDGVHLGHRVLLQRGAALAKQRGVPLVVSTFESHPLQLIAPEKCPAMLCTFEERNALMAALGVDVLFARPFTPQVMHMPPADYVGHLVRSFHPTDVVCGYNHTFGSMGKGNPALLSALGQALGFATSVVPHITLDGQDVSSTVIRKALCAGQVGRAWQMLSRPYRLEAVLTHRQGQSCRAALIPQGKQALPNGRYFALVGDESRRYPAAVTLEGEALAFALPRALPMASTIRLQWLHAK